MFTREAPLQQPLTEDDYVQLEVLLGLYAMMNIEEVDGFFAALISGPETVLPGEYLQLVMDMEDEEAVFPSREQAEIFFNLLFRYWNEIARALDKEIALENDFFVPYLLRDEEGNASGNDWANSFILGMDMCRNGWKTLLDDEDKGGAIIPIFALAHEHDPDPQMRSFLKPIDKEAREMLIAGLSVGAKLAYDYFRPRRLAAAKQGGEDITVRRKEPKIGRNDPCPCGSGRKYKRCCALTAV